MSELTKVNIALKRKLWPEKFQEGNTMNLDLQVIKKIISPWILWGVFTTVLYIAIAFFNWEMNPGNWSEASRFILALISLAILIPIGAYHVAEHL